MTDYSDVPQTNALYTEQQQVRRAMDYLTKGGTISSMVIMSAPIDPSLPAPAMMGTPVTIALPRPNPQSLVDQAMAALQARDDEITQELASLGVTNPPASTRRKA